MTARPPIDPPDYLPKYVIAWAAEHRELLEMIVEDFLESAEWPLRRDLSRKLVREGVPTALDTVLATMPRPLGFVQGHPDQVVLLLFALRLTSSGQGLLASFTGALRRSFELFAGDDEEPTLTRAEIGQWETDTDPFINALSEILFREAPFLGNKAGRPSEQWTCEVTEDVVRYADAATADDYLRIRAAELSAMPQFGFAEPPTAGDPEAERGVQSAERPSGEVRDVFISHAGEDKDSVARPLAQALKDRGHSVWFDEAELVIGDSLVERINQGLAESRAGVVVLSPDFFSKPWPQEELGALVEMQIAGKGRVLPIWHGVDRDFLAEKAPLLAHRLAADTKNGLAAVADAISRALAQLPAGGSSDAADDTAPPGLGMDPEPPLQRNPARLQFAMTPRPTGREMQERAPVTPGAPEHWMVYDGMLLFRVIAYPVPSDLRGPRGGQARELLEAAAAAARDHASQRWRAAASGLLLKTLCTEWDAAVPRSWSAGRSSSSTEVLTSRPTAAATLVTRPVAISVDRTFPTAVATPDGGVYHAAHEPEIAADTAAVCKFVGLIFEAIGAKQGDVMVQIAAGASTSRLVSAEAYADLPFSPPHEGIALRPPFAATHYSDFDRFVVSRLVIEPEACAAELLDDWLATFRENDVFEELRG